MTDVGQFEDLAKTIQENTKPSIQYAEKGEENKAPFAVIPNGMQVHNISDFLDKYKTKPDRRIGTINADRLPSFIDIVNRFKSEESVIFAQCAVNTTSIKAHIKAIFNYHPESENNTDAKFCDHKAKYEFPISSDFSYWLKNNREPMSQIDFALFLEERMIDIAVPNKDDMAPIEGLKPKFADPLNIMELSKDLELYSNESFKSKNKLSSGETEFKFSAEHVDSNGKPVQIPDFFVINVPLFEGGKPQRLPVRLRYRLNQGKVMWFYDLYRMDKAFEVSFEESCADAAKKTDLPLYFGSPE